MPAGIAECSLGVYNHLQLRTSCPMSWRQGGGSLRKEHNHHLAESNREFGPRSAFLETHFFFLAEKDFIKLFKMLPFTYSRVYIKQLLGILGSGGAEVGHP